VANGGLTEHLSRGARSQSAARARCREPGHARRRKGDRLGFSIKISRPSLTPFPPGMYCPRRHCHRVKTGTKFIITEARHRAAG
jgi:hypothetical protein